MNITISIMYNAHISCIHININGLYNSHAIHVMSCHYIPLIHINPSEYYKKCVNFVIVLFCVCYFLDLLSLPRTTSTS